MNIIKAAEKFALEEIEKYHSPTVLHWKIANKKGIKLANELNADEKVVRLGTNLMDIKLGQALEEGRIQDHIKMSVEATKKFLGQFDLSKEIKNKVINSVAAHHGTRPYLCIEAEICANADCFRFLSPQGFIAFLFTLGKRDMPFLEALSYAESKVEEKYKIISLNICKKEAMENYKLLKRLITLAKSSL